MAPQPIATAGEALVSQVEKKLVFDSQPAKDVETSTPTIAERASLKTVFPPLVLEEHPIDTVPRIKVVVIGAGIAGINAGILLPRKVPDIDLVILERHADLVGLGFYCTVHPFKDPMLILTGWNMAFQHLPRRQMRHPIRRLPEHLCTANRLDRELLTWC